MVRLSFVLKINFNPGQHEFHTIIACELTRQYQCKFSFFSKLEIRHKRI